MRDEGRSVSGAACAASRYPETGRGDQCHLKVTYNILFTRPDKGKGVVILDKEYISKVENILSVEVN